MRTRRAGSEQNVRAGDGAVRAKGKARRRERKVCCLPLASRTLGLGGLSFRALSVAGRPKERHGLRGHMNSMD